MIGTFVQSEINLLAIYYEKDCEDDPKHKTLKKF